MSATDQGIEETAKEREGDAPLEQVLEVEDKGKRMDRVRDRDLVRVHAHVDHGKDAQVHENLWDKKDRDRSEEEVLLVC